MNVQELKPTSKCNIIHLSIDVKFRLPMKPQVKKNLKQINKNTQKNADFINTFFYCRQKDSITLMFFLPHLAANYKKRGEAFQTPFFMQACLQSMLQKEGGSYVSWFCCSIVYSISTMGENQGYRLSNPVLDLLYPQPENDVLRCIVGTAWISLK